MSEETILNYMGEDIDSIRTELDQALEEKALWVNYARDEVTAGIKEMFIYEIKKMIYLANRSVEELFFRTMRQRQSAVAKAYDYGYSITRASASSMEITITLPMTVVTSDYVLAKDSYIIFDDLPFVIDSAVSVPVGSSSVSSVIIKQQVLKYKEIVSNGEIDQEITINNIQDLLSNEDFRVYVGSDFTDSTKYTEWTEVASLLSSVGSDAHYTIYFDENELPHIRFGNGVMGKVPEQGQYIRVYYYETKGPNGKLLSTSEEGTLLYKTFPDQENYQDYESNNIEPTCVNSTATSGGAFAETMEEITYYAPLEVNSREVLCTRPDHKSKILSEVSNLSENLIKCRCVGEYEVSQLAGSLNHEDLNKLLIYLVLEDYATSTGTGGGSPAADTDKYKVKSYCENQLRKMETTYYHVYDATVIDVWVDITTYSEFQYSQTEVQSDVADRLLNTLFVLSTSNTYIDIGKTLRKDWVTANMRYPNLEKVWSSNIDLKMIKLVASNPTAAGSPYSVTLEGAEWTATSALKLRGCSLYSYNGTTFTLLCADDGAGALTGVNISGTIDYDTGALSITVVDPTYNALDIYCIYEQNSTNLELSYKQILRLQSAHINHTPQMEEQV